MPFPLSRTVSIVALAAAILAFPAAARAQGEILPDPRQPASGFKPHELAFRTPADGVARAEYKSAPFYAVILKSAPRCSLPEQERLEAQALFPANKVFSTRFQCDDNVEENIDYTNVDRRFGFIAVYAGVEAGEGERFLEKVRATGRFPGANLRRMQAVLVYP